MRGRQPVELLGLRQFHDQRSLAHHPLSCYGNHVSRGFFHATPNGGLCAEFRGGTARYGANTASMKRSSSSSVL